MLNGNLFPRHIVGNRRSKGMEAIQVYLRTGVPKDNTRQVFCAIIAKDAKHGTYKLDWYVTSVRRLQEIKAFAYEGETPKRGQVLRWGYVDDLPSFVNLITRDELIALQLSED